MYYDLLGPAMFPPPVKKKASGRDYAKEENARRSGPKSRLTPKGATLTDALKSKSAAAFVTKQLALSKAVSVQTEADFIGAALAAGLSGTWDGKASVEWLKTAKTNQHCQMEWPGFYGEHMALAILPMTSLLERKFKNTVIDYAYNYLWDIKVHNDGAVGSEVQLNSYEAVVEAVSAGGLGFIVICGTAVMDTDGSFKTWHDDFKGKSGSSSGSGYSRPRKKMFTPTAVELYRINDLSELKRGLESGAFTVAAQGRQANGDIRNDKLHMKLKKASSFLVARFAVAQDSAGSSSQEHEANNLVLVSEQTGNPFAFRAGCLKKVKEIARRKPSQASQAKTQTDFKNYSVLLSILKTQAEDSEATVEELAAYAIFIEGCEAVLGSLAVQQSLVNVESTPKLSSTSVN